MCGIIGYVGSRPAVDILVQGLKRLEYRGYDSAGVAILVGQKIEVLKSEGRLENVERLLTGQSLNFRKSTCGIGHTRWATHGKPNTNNAHPHRIGHVILVHNGIIENYLDIKKELLAKGHKPVSETDSELLGFLVMEEMDNGVGLVQAVRNSFKRLQGQCSVVVMSEREPGVLVGVRNGSPMVAAIDPEGGVIVASDAQPLLQFSREVYFLEHGDVVVGAEAGLTFYDLETGRKSSRKTTLLNWSADQLDKGGYPHYMLKEIYEQPDSIVETMNGILDRVNNEPYSFQDQKGVQILDDAKELIFVACGTSWHACLLAKYWIERFANIPVSVDLASEFRYREPAIRPGVVVIGVSQSGETADTLAVLREMKRRKIPVIGISNVRGSTISREADDVFYTSAGPEIGVAATKTLTSQMLVMFLMAGHLAAKNKTKNSAELKRSLEDVMKLPHLLAKGLSEESNLVHQVKRCVQSLQSVKGFFFIGRGYAFPIALEGALKLKEIAYDYAEGYAAGELKHGPIAMIDQSMVVVVLAPQDSWRDKTVSNLEEVKARGAIILGIGHEGDSDLRQLCDHWLPLPSETHLIDQSLLPFILTPMIQLLSYHRAVLKGTDVDKPRNLAKSVTVE